MRKVTLFTRAGCHLCALALQTIEHVRSRVGIELEVIDIDLPANERWLDQYDHHVPVVHIDGQEFAHHRLDERAFASALEESSGDRPSK